LSKTTKSLSQANRWLCRDSKWVPPEYRPL